LNGQGAGVVLRQGRSLKCGGERERKRERARERETEKERRKHIMCHEVLH